MNCVLFLLSLAPGMALGFSLPSGETGDVSQIGYWAELSASERAFSGRLLAEDFRSRGDGFYHATVLSLAGGLSFSPGRIFSLGFSVGPSLLFRTHSQGSERGLGCVAQADGLLFYPGERARFGFVGFTRAYPGRRSVLLSFGIGLFAGANPK